MSRTTSAMRNSALRAMNRTLNESLNVIKAGQQQHQAEMKDARVQARQTERDRVKFTADDLRDAIAVRDSIGWHKVIRVSAKSVTVDTPYSWTDRIAVEKVLEFK